MVHRTCDICKNPNAAKYVKPIFQLTRIREYIIGDSVPLNTMDSIDLCDKCLHEKQIVLNEFNKMWNSND